MYSYLSAGAESPRDCLSIFCPLATLGHRAGNWAKLDIIITIVDVRKNMLFAGGVYGGRVGVGRCVVAWLSVWGWWAVEEETVKYVKVVDRGRVERV